MTPNLHQSRTLATLRDTLLPKLPKLPSGELSIQQTGVTERISHQENETYV